MSDLFESDEMHLMPVHKHWLPSDLLAAQGIFYLKDVARKLCINTSFIKQRAKLLESNGEMPWTVMGVRKVCSHWIVRMTVFAPYYLTHLKSQFSTVFEPELDANTLLQQKGIFKLVKVCEYLPFTPSQIRYQANKCVNSRKEIGVWKDEKQHKFMVDMPTFAVWVKNLWSSSTGF